LRAKFKISSSGMLTSSDYKMVPTPVLSPKQVSQLSKRLCTDSAAHKEQRMEALRQKYLKAEVPTSSKKLQTAEQEGFVLRVYQQSTEHKNATLKKLDQKYLSPIIPIRKLTKEEFSSSVDKLYTFSITQKQSNMEKLERKYLPDLLAKKLDADQMTDSLQRLYGGQKQQHEAMLSNLRKKYLFQHPDAAKPKLSAEKLAELRERLSHIDMEEDALFRHPHITAKSRKKLEAKYIAGTLPEFPKVPEAKWAETITRLAK